MLESNTFWISITFLSGIFEILVVKFIFDKFAKLKNHYEIDRRIIVYSLFLLFDVIVTLLILIGITPFLRIFIYFILICFLYKLNYKVTLPKTILICMFSCFLLISVDSISTALLGLLFPNVSLNKILQIGQIRLEYIILDSTVLLVSLPFINILKLKVNFSKIEYFLTILPTLVYIACMLGIFNVMINTKLNSNIIIVLLLVSFSLLILSIYTFFTMYKVFKYKDSKTINFLVDEKARLLFQYYSNLSNFDSLIKTDFNTKNDLLNLILEDKKILCEKKNIIFDADLDFSCLNSIEEYDICNIITNFIDSLIYISDNIKSDSIKINGKKCGNSNQMYLINCKIKGEYKNLYENIDSDIIKEKKSLSEDETLFKNMYTTSVANALNNYNADLTVNIKKEIILMSIFFNDINFIKK